MDGSDVLAPVDNSVISQWDKYAYEDYTDRVISVEVETEQNEPYSVVQSMADITFSNHDNFFTPKSGSPIEDYILPRRPFRILMGFGGEVVPKFVGLSTRIPEINKRQKTAKFHCIDFLTYIFEKKIDQTAMLLNNSTSEILDYLFQEVGLSSDQYVLDETSFNRINYFYAEKGQSLGDIIRPLMAAEQGRLWMDELGIIRFLNRQNYPTTTVYDFGFNNTVDYDTSTEDDIINTVTIKSSVLKEQPNQKVWEFSQPEIIPAGNTVDIWANFDDPMTGVDSPTLQTGDIEASYFRATEDEEGGISSVNISLESFSDFNKAAVMTFKNNGTTPLYLFAVVLWGTPVKVIDTIIVEDSDQASIDDFEQRLYELDTNYIQSKDDAISKAAIMVRDYKNYGSVVEFEAKGNPALQIGDGVNLDLDGFQGDHIITKIYDYMGGKGQYRQQLRGTHKDPTTYFILDRSVLNGSDVLSP